MDELFVYWHALPGDAAAAEAALRAWHAQLRAAVAGLAVNRFRRDEPQRNRCTFMETYAAAPSAELDAATLERIVSEGNQRLAPWLLGARHVEHFRRLD
jgi:hypothetical protein